MVVLVADGKWRERLEGARDEITPRSTRNDLLLSSWSHFIMSPQSLTVVPPGRAKDSIRDPVGGYFILTSEQHIKS
jgi:hypothetical protein